MAESQTVAELRALLEKYAGVFVEDIRELKSSSQGTDKISVTLRFVDAASLVRITHAAAGANTGGSCYEVGVPVDGEPMSESLGRMRFQYELGLDGKEPVAEWFGLFLVWDLVKREVLERKEGERLCALWNGAPRW